VTGTKDGDEMERKIAEFKTDKALQEARNAIQDIIGIFSDTHCEHCCECCDNMVKEECRLIGKIDTYLRNCGSYALAVVLITNRRR